MFSSKPFRYITLCSADQDEYKALEDGINAVIQRRNNNFTKLQFSNTQKLKSVKNFYNEVVPKGMSPEDYKIMM